jgi:cellulose 1,4-beta-cellobiosidase
MHHSSSLFLSLLVSGAARAQQIGHEQMEVHPKLQWKRCTAPGACKNVSGSITADADWRWLHKVNGFESCHHDARWDSSVCSSAADCTANCALDGGGSYADSFGITTKQDALTLRYRTVNSIANSVNSRVFLLDEADEQRYQTFVLMNNELAFDVDLNEVECGLNSALYFVAMEPDGGKAKYPTNKAGAAYGTGYCDASCSTSSKYIGGKANYDEWVIDGSDPTGGSGSYGACCPEFDIWNSNAHSFSMSSKPCVSLDYKICRQPYCDPEKSQADILQANCDKQGCNFNPYRLGNTNFYGRGKTVDTRKKFTVVTQFRESGITQYFVQNGKKIKRPAPKDASLGKSGDLTESYCDNMFNLFAERNRFVEVGGWEQQNTFLRKPMVLTMALGHDSWAWNLWLDSRYPTDGDPTAPGVVRGPCSIDDHEPLHLQEKWPSAKVAWSNIRFGPIGSTVA